MSRNGNFYDEVGQMSDWDTDTAVRIGNAVKKLRQKNGWTAARLSEETAALKHPIHRVAIGKLENGHRGAKFDVTELLVLSKALGVPPALLLFPDQPSGELDILPGVTTTSFAATQRFSGEENLMWYAATPDSHPHLDRSAGLHYDGPSIEDWGNGALALILARREATLWSQLHKYEQIARDSVDTADETGAAPAELIRITKNHITEVRDRQREHGLTPISLPNGYSDIDARSKAGGRTNGQT